MGDVVQMDDWRNRKVKQYPITPGKTYTMGTKPPKFNRDEVIRKITQLLTEALECGKNISSLPTVQQRERAAIKGMELTMQADAFAKQYGFRIERVRNDIGGLTTYNIIG